MSFNSLFALFFTVVISTSCASDRDVHYKRPGFEKKNTPLRNRLLTASSGSLGCPPEAIELRNFYVFDVFYSTWEARCRGHVFYCSQSHTSVTCSEEIAEEEKPPVHPSGSRPAKPASQDSEESGDSP